MRRPPLTMVNMTAAADAPIVFKSFMLGFYTAEVQRVLPRTCFVLVNRDPVDNALSILNMRRQFSRDENSWTGVKPLAYPQYADSAPVVQATAQAWLVEAAYRRALAKIRPDHTLILSYESVCEQPEAALESIESMMTGAGGRMVRTSHELPNLKARHANDSDERRAVQRALQDIQRNHP
ncbi:MAG TPA: hypothetical protein EYN66_07105 [Myxococcales bacterium]|nr:hypothetical protein [Myxococcales bacterium]